MKQSILRVWIFLFLLSFPGAVVVVVSGQEGFPKISIGGWMESDFHSEWIHNSTPPLGTSPFPYSIVVPSSVRGLSLICNASYPIEWKFHREHWGGRSRLQIGLQTTRFSDGLNVISFSSELSFFSFESNSVSGNYTCQKVGLPSLSSSMYVFWEGGSPPFLTLARSYRKPPQINVPPEKNSVVLPCMVSMPKVTPSLSKQVADHDVDIPLNQSVTYDPRVGFTLKNLPFPYGRYTCQVGDAEDDGDGDLITFNVVNGTDMSKAEFNETIRHGAYYLINSVTKEITCCAAGPKAPKLKHVSCEHPTICVLAKHTLHTMESSKKRNGSCSTVKMHALRAGAFRCVGAGIDLVREYFYPMPEDISVGFPRRGGPKGQRGKNVTTPTKGDTNSTTPPPEPYDDWNEADKLKMMLVTKLKGPVYIGEERSFICKASPFYYAQGIVWGVTLQNQTTQYYNGRDGREPHPYLQGGSGRHFGIVFGKNQAYLDITIIPELESVTCFAPVWNSTEWGRKQIRMVVKAPTAPTMLGRVHQQVTWYLKDTNKKLECQFTGEPMPKVVWKKGNQTFALNTFNENGTSTVTFPLVDLNTQNDYECTASNTAGSVVKKFHVVVAHGSSTTVSVILVLSLLGFVVVSTVLGFAFRYMRNQKNVMNRLANLAFKDVTSPENTANLPSHVPTDSNATIGASSPQPQVGVRVTPATKVDNFYSGSINGGGGVGGGGGGGDYHFMFANSPPSTENPQYEDVAQIRTDQNQDEQIEDEREGTRQPAAFTNYQKL